MSKLVAEVDKLLEKGKVPEAIEKLRAAIRSEPLNQLLVSKLANIYVEKGEPKNASLAYTGLATRLGEAGKSQVAIAIYKQAIDFDPLNFELRIKFAQENESCGKIADAHAQGQLVYQHYLKRKKYFDCAGLFPLLVRTQPKDEKLKQAWIEILQLSQAEQKMVHLLVALAGPPGLVSKEFPTGGEPTNLSQATYDALRRLVMFFPRDPKIAYTVAWSAFKRGNLKDCYQFLREALRREPDFCLATLLFARLLAESKKLNESLFVYKFFKERMGSDKSSDLLTLNRLLESFVEANGWITFTEGMGVEELDAATFLASFTGEAPQASAEGSTENQASTAEGEEPAQEQEGSQDKTGSLSPPAEIELGGEIGLPAADEAEILLTSGHTKVVSSQNIATENTQPPKASPKPAPVVQQAPVAQVSAPAEAKQSEPVPAETNILAQEKTGAVRSDQTGTVEFTSIIKAPPSQPSDHQSSEQSPNTSTSIETPSEPRKPQTFNPLADLQAPPEAPKEAEVSDKTQIFSPVDLIAANDALRRELRNVQTKVTLNKPEEIKQPLKEPTASVPSIATESSANVSATPPVEGEKTQMFTPMESVQAGVESRKPMHAKRDAIPPTSAPSPSVDQEMPSVTSTENRSFTATEAEITTLEQLASEGEATQILNLSALKEQLKAQPTTEEPPEQKQPPLPPARIPEPEPEQEMATSVIAMPSPQQMEKTAEEPVLEIPPSASKPEVNQIVQPTFSPESKVADSDELKEEVSEIVDLGDDLLQEPTRPISDSESKLNATKVLIEEVRRDVRGKQGSRDPESKQLIDTLLRKAERFVSKRNYYLARKALKHAQALGAENELVKSKLSEIRKMEMPNAVYLQKSTDHTDKRTNEQIIRELEEDFELLEEGGEILSSNYSIGQSIAEVLETLDLQTTIDFGIGIYEMGLYGESEKIFMSAVERFPDDTYNSYYLAAIAKFAQKDYAGAASVLKKLSKEPMRSEKEKIQIFYALGEVFEKLKRHDQSKEFFQKVAKLDSNYRNIKNKISGSNG